MRNTVHQQGMALLLALLAIIAILGAVSLVVGRVQSNMRGTDSTVQMGVLEEAGKAAIDVGIERVWNQYVLGRGNTTGNLASYLAFIDPVVKNNEDLNRNGVKDSTEQDWNGNGSFDTAPAAQFISEGSPMTFGSGAQVTGLTIERTDYTTGVRLTFTATAKMGQATRSVQQTVQTSGQRFNGFQFAVLANNINCLLCHAQITSNDLALNTDASQYGTFDRVKVASLESRLFGQAVAAAGVGGPVYTRGNVYNKDGTLLNAAGIQASQLDGYAFSSTNGKITQSQTGAMTSTNMVAAGTDANGNPLPFANLYLNYPKDPAKMTDGTLPTSFPAPFPDDNGDRVVNPDEFQKYVKSANGSVSFQLPPEQVVGQVKAGVAYGVPVGQTYGGTDLPTASNSAKDALASSGAYSGNLFLVGTAQDPIVIDKKVAVDGDVVLKGPIKGSGQLMVSGTVYVVGDVTYADAPGKFGQAADGTTNAFAVEAGGNILMGDYLTIRAKNDYIDNKTTPTINSDVWQGKFTRMDQATATATMTNGKKTNVGYFDAGVVDAGQAQGREGQYSFTTAELTLFNRMERLKAAPPGSSDYNASYYVPNYKPRYYQLRDGAPVYQYVTSKVTDANLKEHSVNYLSPGVETIAAADLASATVLSLSPKNGWLGESVLRQIWFNDEAARRALGGRQPWKFDGLLYTNNCIFGVTHGNARHGSACWGTMQIRGGIVAADLGLLITDNGDQAGTGLRLTYDRRVDTFLNVEDPTKVEFKRLVYRAL